MKKMKSVLGALALAAMTLGSSGCATYITLLSSTLKKEVSVKGNVDDAVLAAMAAGQELGYTVNSNTSKPTKIVVGIRGWGYFESSNLACQFTDANGSTAAVFMMKSNKGADALNEFLTAFGKKAQVQ